MTFARIAVIVGFFAGISLAQQRQQPGLAPAVNETRVIEPAAASPAPRANSGGSLLRATLGTPIEPGQAKLSQVSFFSVPEPQPKTLKKHDNVTIIVREQSQAKTD